MKQRLLSIPEVARRLGISRQAAWLAVRDGRLESVTVNRPVTMVTEKAVKAYEVNPVRKAAGEARIGKGR